MGSFCNLGVLLASFSPFLLAPGWGRRGLSIARRGKGAGEVAGISGLVCVGKDFGIGGDWVAEGKQISHGCARMNTDKTGRCVFFSHLLLRRSPEITGVCSPKLATRPASGGDDNAPSICVLRAVRRLSGVATLFREKVVLLGERRGFVRSRMK